MIFDTVEGEGSWDLSLRADTPYSVTERLRADDYSFAQLIVTPTRVSIDAIGTGNLNDVAIYCGLYVRQENRTERLAGPGLWAAFGTSSGVGPIVGAGLTGTFTLRQWIENLDLPPFIAADAALDNAVTYTWTSDRVMTYREAMESIFDLVGYPALGEHLFIDPRTMTVKHTSFSSGVAWYFQRAITSGVAYSNPILTPWFAGREVGINQPLIRCRLDSAQTADGWLSDVTVTDAGGTANTAGTKAFTYPGGVDVNMTKYVNDQAIPAGGGGNTASAELALGNEVTAEIVAHSDDPMILDYVAPGTNCGVYDPERGVYDTTSSMLTVRGQVMWPRYLTAQSVRAPIREGNGVYLLRRIPAGDDAIDLSQWFIPESGDVTIELGSARPWTLRNTNRRAGARRQ